MTPIRRTLLSMIRRSSVSYSATGEHADGNIAQPVYRRRALCARALHALAVLSLLAAPAVSTAQEFPSKPITIVVPFPPGGGTDVAARVLGEAMSATLGQPVIVVNRAGAGGNIGAASVAKAAPDGYTIVMATQGTHGSNASLYKSMPYDTIADFAPITLVASTPLILVTNSKSQATTVRELIALAKTKPGALNYGSSSVGGSPHLAMELFKSMTGIQMVHIPYQGSAPARSALLAGDIQVMFDNVPSSLPVVRDGRFRALGVSGRERSGAAPDVPTVAEAGVPGFEISAWYGLLAPANTPPAVVRKLNAAAVTALRSKEVADKLRDLGYDPVGNSPEQFAAQIRTDVQKYRQLVENAKLEKQ